MVNSVSARRKGLSLSKALVYLYQLQNCSVFVNKRLNFTHPGINKYIDEARMQGLQTGAPDPHRSAPLDEGLVLYY